MKKLLQIPVKSFCLVFLLASICLAESPDLKRALKHLEESVPQAMSQTGTPGLAVAVVQGDTVVYQKGFGVRRLGEASPVTPETVFQIGSISKSFTAALVGMLVDQRKIEWKDRVVDHLPGFRLADPWVTREFRVFDLMSQHSGLPYTAGDLQLFFQVDRNHVVEVLRHFQPASSFRTEFAYQNGLFLAAAQLLEEKTGQRWERLLQERLFEPLGMNRTTSSFADYMAESNRAGLHQSSDGRVNALAWEWPYLGYVDLLGPAGGINSNALDMARYLTFRMNESSDLLSKESAHFLRRPQTVVRPGLYYCQAWMYMERPEGPFIWHNGETSGAKNMLCFVPDKKIGIVVLSNLRANPLPEWVALSFLDSYFGQPVKAFENHKPQEETPQPPARPAPHRALEDYQAVFQNPVYGSLEVASRKGRVEVRFDGKGPSYPLKHWDGDRFWLQLPVVDAPADGFVDFSFSPEGKVESVLLEAFDDGSVGTFRRL